jgi:dihydrolipoamide dehydrogenase
VSGGEEADLVVLGGGPGGYTAAFRAADLGLSVTLVERHAKIGGVCLHVGCIPSKALLHAAKVIAEVEHARTIGVEFGDPVIDLDTLRRSPGAVVDRLASGLGGLARKRGVRIVRGTGRLTGERELTVAGEDGEERIAFAHAIIAVGSEPVRLPGMPDDPRVMDSQGALALEEIPDRLLVIGGGIIGLEMACVYDALGARVSVVEMAGQLIPGCDPDLVEPLVGRLRDRYDAVHVETRVAGVEAGGDGLHVDFEGERAPGPERFDRILVAVGRRASGDLVGAEDAGVAVGEGGVIAVDERLRTNVAHIHAIGDVTGEPMLAHRAAHQGAVAAEVIAGEDAVYDPKVVPAVAYTDPEIAWVGLTETDAERAGVPVEVARFPWAASGRALGEGRGEGRSKLLVDPETRRILGAGIVGVHAGDLISEAALAIEMGADADDVALTIHPHPTLSETVGLSAQAAEGTITDLYLGRETARRG